MTEKLKPDNDTTEEAHAYTPGLKVKRSTLVSKKRRLPILGEVFVKEGDVVNSDRILARAELKGDPEIIKASMLLSIEPEDVPRYMHKTLGDNIEEGELLASYTALFGLIKKRVESPRTGTIESISDVTGQVIIRGIPIPVEVDAYIPGKIVEILPKEGAVIATNAAFIQGIFGIGGEDHGRIKIAVESSDDVLTVDAISPEDKGAILVGGSLVTLDAINKCVEVGVSCIVVGGIRHEDLTSFTKEEVGVAITGQEELGVTLIITEGFGKMRMSKATFDLLKSFEGFTASVNGETQIRAGVLRPEIIIPHDEVAEEGSGEELSSGMVPGTPVRIIRQPYFGAIGEVVHLPVELQQVESESHVRVLDVKLDDDTIVTVPRANVEIIEE
jgi:biotin carboxyl carrier protein